MHWHGRLFPTQQTGPVSYMTPVLALRVLTVVALHQHIIPMFGMPIGELWDLEELAATCARLGKYSFLLTSAPLRVPGGVASPPNAIAIF